MFYYFYNTVKNKYFDELKDEKAPMREAVLFRKTVEEIPIFVEENDLIACRYGCESYEEKDKEIKEFKKIDYFTDKDREILKNLNEKFGMSVENCLGHICLNYERILNSGINSYIEEVEGELKGCTKGDKKDFLEAMLYSLNSIELYCKRIEAMAEECFENTQKNIYKKMAETVKRVPMNPANDFYEALTSVWIMHSLIAISDKCWASISLGRFDQYMYPFYKKVSENEEERKRVKEYIKSFFVYLNLYGDAACALNIGGMDKNGNDEMNGLSALLIETEKELQLASPLLAARINPKTDDEMIDSLIDYKLFGIGQPTFYGELPCRRAVMERGIPEAEAVKFTVNSCMGLFMTGEEIASMWGCVVNSHTPLEMAVNFGKPIFNELPFDIDLDIAKEPECEDELIKFYAKAFSEIMKKITDLNIKNEKNLAANSPNPLLSALTEGCVKAGKDRAVGARYNTQTVETYALINTGNAICAITELVFRQKKYTLKEMIEGIKNNYAGFEAMQRDIKSCDKYGTGVIKCDRICKRLCEEIAKACKRLNYDNISFLPSLHTLDNNVYYGEILPATFDGRNAGEPVNKNAGPSNENRSADPTGVILSAASLNQYMYSGGQPIDLYFDRALLESKTQRDKIKVLIKTYFELGGLQLQVNCIDVELLKAAYKEPDKYPYLIVRIGGYSRKFTELSKKSQKEFIERFEKEKGV